MPRLYLLRHAKAVPGSAGQRDHARPLADRGRDDASLIGRHMATEGYAPELTLASTAARSRETFAYLAMAFAPPPTALFLDTLYEAGAEGYLQAIRRHGGAAASLLIVGHNPAIEVVARTLVGDGALIGAKFPTGALVALDFDALWADVAPGSGRLVAFVRPADLGGGEG